MGQFFIVALFGWGVYKCIVTARLPTANAKGAYSLALILIAWAIGVLAGGVITVDRRGRPILLDSDAAFLFQVYIVCLLIALAAVVLAVLGLRETGKPRSADEIFASVPGRGMAIFAIVLSSLMVAFPIIGILVTRR